MKRSQFAESKILMLRQAEEAASIGEFCCTSGISAANDNWRKKNARLTALEMLLQRLEAQNGQLKKIATDLSLENEMLRRKSAVQFYSRIEDVAG
jgi:hypothetical protein